MGYWIAQYTGTGRSLLSPDRGSGRSSPTRCSTPAMTTRFTSRLYRTGSGSGSVPRSDSTSWVPTPDSRRTTAGGNTERLRERLREEFADYDRDELVETLADANVPVGPLQYVDELVDDDQVESRRLLTDSYNLGRDAPVRTAGAPFETAAGRPSLDDCPPEVGEHTREVLSEHGYSAEETWRLIDDDVVVAAEADD